MQVTVVKDYKDCAVNNLCIERLAPDTTAVVARVAGCPVQFPSGQSETRAYGDNHDSPLNRTRKVSCDTTTQTAMGEPVRVTVTDPEVSSKEAVKPSGRGALAAAVRRSSTSSRSVGELCPSSSAVLATPQ